MADLCAQLVDILKTEEASALLTGLLERNRPAYRLLVSSAFEFYDKNFETPTPESPIMTLENFIDASIVIIPKDEFATATILCGFSTISSSRHVLKFLQVFSKPERMEPFISSAHFRQSLAGFAGNPTA